MILCGGWGDLLLTRNADEITEYFRSMKGLKPVPEWIFKVLDIIFESKEKATFENLRVREWPFTCFRELTNIGRIIGTPCPAHTLSAAVTFLIVNVACPIRFTRQPHVPVSHTAEKKVSHPVSLPSVIHR